MSPRTLQGRIVALVLAAVLVPVLAVGCLTGALESRALHAAYSQLLVSLAQGSADRVGDWIDERRRVVATLAQAQALRTGLPVLRARGLEAAREHPEVLGLIQTVDTLEDSFPWIAEARISDPATGRVLVSSRQGVVGQPWVPLGAQREGDLEKLRGGELVQSPVVVSDVSERTRRGEYRTAAPCLFFSAPIGGEGRVEGILGIRLNGVALGDITFMDPGLAGKAGRSLEVYLLDAHGRLLTPSRFLPEAELKMQAFVPGTTVPTFPLLSYQEWRAGRTAQPASNVAGYRDYRGVLVVGAWSPVPNTDWVAVAEVDRSEMMRPVRDLAVLTLVAVVGVGLVFAVVGATLAQALLVPVRALQEVASRFAAGDRSVRCEYDRPDELGDMARAFNELASVVDAALKELEEARDAALEASRAKSRFLANMGHELRTPLNAVIGYTEMLMEEAAASGDEATIGDLRRIHEAGTHLLTMVSDVLDVTRLDTNRMVLHLEETPLEEILEPARVLATPLAERNSNRLEVRVAGPVEGLRTDRARLLQILDNLLSNACRFTRGGLVTLEVEPRGSDVLFRVRDTGVGIAPEQMGRLFEAFTQADDSAGRQHGGTGLGLALVKRLVALLGGTVAVETRPGAGSTFEVLLPLRGPGEAEAPASSD